jgi:hypothetical protein
MDLESDPNWKTLALRYYLTVESLTIEWGITDSRSRKYWA